MTIENNIVKWTPDGTMVESGNVTLTAIHGTDRVEQIINIPVVSEASINPIFPLDLGQYEINQTATYLRGGKPIPGNIITVSDDTNAILRTDIIQDIKWTDLNADVHGFAIIGLIAGTDPALGVYGVTGYQYLDNNMAVRGDDLVITWPTVNVNGMDNQYVLRLEVS